MTRKPPKTAQEVYERDEERETDPDSIRGRKEMVERFFKDKKEGPPVAASPE